MENTARPMIDATLSPGERLLWSGQPRGGVRLRGSDVFVIPFTLLWCGFAIFWEFMAVTKTKGTGPGSAVAPLFGLPFVLVGLYLVFGRFIVDAQMRRRIFYGITNERIIIVSGLFTQRTKSLNLRTLTDVTLTERSDGSGTIAFGPAGSFGQWFAPAGWPGAGQYAVPSFDMIDQAKDVYETIRQAQKTAT